MFNVARTVADVPAVVVAEVRAAARQLVRDDIANGEYGQDQAAKMEAAHFRWLMAGRVG